jgi:hypothetical protein
MDIGPPGGAVRSCGLAITGPRLPQFHEQMTAALAPLYRDDEQDPRERRREGGALLRRTLPATAKPDDDPYMERSRMLTEIADAADLNLVADSHTQPRRLRPLLAGRTVEEAVAAVCELWQSDWRVQQGTLLVRSHDWWLDDPAEPPATAMAEWQGRFQANGVLDLEDAAHIAALSREQQQRVALRIREAKVAFHPWLRWYAGLTAAQKEAMRSPQGLALHALPAPVRRQFLTAYFKGDLLPRDTARVETLASGQAVLRLSEDQRQGRPVLLFSYTPLGTTRQPGASATVWLPYRTGPDSGNARAPGAR